MSTATSLPKHIARYQVSAHLGSGAFADVYRAYDPQLDRDVAVKVVRGGVLSDAGAVKRFLREGKVAARLCHPHIVSVFDAGRDGDRYYLAATYIDGETLAQRLERGPLDAHAAAALVRDLAEALQHAHQLGIIHRDVKPANILLDARGAAHLADFGLAHVRESLEKLTHDGTLLGTPAYMAPELAAGQTVQPPPASDQYSLGVVLYELLCGRPPFRGDLAKVLHDAVHTPPISPRRVAASVPRDLETIALKALAKRPEDRYADCQELANDLRRWLEGEPIRARRLSLPERLARWVRREPKLAWTSLSAAAVLFLAALTPLLASLLLGATLTQEQQERQRLETSTNTALSSATEAGEQRRLALEATAQAATAFEEAQTATQSAAAATQRLPEETKKQEAALALVQQRQRERRRYQYVADINRAYQAYQEPNLSKMQTLMKGLQPFPGEEDFRGFEWDYLVNQTRQESLNPEFLAETPGEVQVLVFLKNDSGLVAASVSRTAKTWTLTISGYKPKEQFSFVSDRVATDRLHQISDYKPNVQSPWFSKSSSFSPVGLNDKLSPLEQSKCFREGIFLSPEGILLIKQAYAAFSSHIVDLNGIQNKDPDLNEGLGIIKQSHPITQASFSAGSKRVAVLHAPDTTVEIWNTETKTESINLKIPGVQRVLLSPDGKTLATLTSGATSDKDFRLQTCDVATGKVKLAAVDLIGMPAPMTFTPDNKVLIAHDNKGLHIWDLQSGKERVVLCGGERIESFACTPDNTALAVVSVLEKESALSRVLSLWEIATGTVRGTAILDNSLTASVPSFAFSPDSRSLAVTNDAERTVVIFESLTARKRVTLQCQLTRISSIVFSPNGNWLAVGGRGGKIGLWDRSQFEHTGKLENFSMPVSSLMPLPHVNALAITQGKKVELIDLDTKFSLEPLPEQINPVTCITSESTGKTLVTGSEDGTIKLWKTETRTEEKMLSGTASAIRTLAMSADGKTVATGRENGTIAIWDCVTYQSLPAPRPQKNPIRALALTPDNKYLALTTEENTVELWNIHKKFVAGILKGHKAVVTALAIDFDGKTCASGSADGTIIIWDLAAYKAIYSVPGHKGAIRSLLFTPDGKTVISNGMDEKIKLWEVFTGSELTSFDNLPAGSSSLTFVPHGNVIVTASRDRTVSFGLGRNTANSLPDAPLSDSFRVVSRDSSLKGHKRAIRALVFSPDSKTLASRSEDRTIKLWNVATGIERTSFEAYWSSPTSMAFSPDGKTLSWAIEIGNRFIALRNLSTGKVNFTSKGAKVVVDSLCFSPDDKTMASGARKLSNIQIWDAKTGEAKSTLQDSQSNWGTQSVLYSPNGMTLAIIMTAHSIKLWDVATGKALTAIDVQNSWIECLAFSPDSKILAFSGGINQAIRLWNISTGKEQATLQGSRTANSIALSPDGKTLASANRDNSITLWNLETGKEQVTLQGHWGGVLCVAFSLDGKTLASGSEDTTIKLWDLKSVPER